MIETWWNIDWIKTNKLHVTCWKRLAALSYENVNNWAKRKDVVGHKCDQRRSSQVRSATWQMQIPAKARAAEITDPNFRNLLMKIKWHSDQVRHPKSCEKTTSCNVLRIALQEFNQLTMCVSNNAARTDMRQMSSPQKSENWTTGGFLNSMMFNSHPVRTRLSVACPISHPRTFAHRMMMVSCMFFAMGHTTVLVFDLFHFSLAR